MDFNHGKLTTYTAMAISHLNLYFLKIFRFLERNGPTFVIHLLLPELDTVSRSKQAAPTCKRHTGMRKGSHSFQPSTLPRKDQLWTCPPPLPNPIPYFQLHLTFKSSSMKWPKDKLFEICSAQSGAHPERMETFPIVSLSFGRFCNVHYKFMFMGNAVQIGVWRKKPKTFKVLNPTYWLKPCENIFAGGKASWKVSVVLASPPVKIFSRHQLTVFAMIKDMISKCKLLFLSLFILGLKRSLVKWQSSISLHA